MLLQLALRDIGQLTYIDGSLGPPGRKQGGRRYVLTKCGWPDETSIWAAYKHNGRFDYVSGKALGAPVLEDVRTYPVKVAAAALAVQVPGELSLVGFDNSSLARLRALWLARDRTAGL